MHKRKVKEKSKFLFFRIIVPFIALFGLLCVLYFYFPKLIDNNLISPIARVASNSDKGTIEEALLKNGVSYFSVDIASDSSYLVTLQDGGKVIITSKKSIPSQISSLQLMLNRLTIEGKRIKIVDFRFDKPIIRL